MKSNYSILLESLNSAKKIFLDSGKIPLDIFEQLVELDPSTTKKYLEWLCKEYVEEGITVEQLQDILIDFIKAVEVKFNLPSTDIYFYDYETLKEDLDKFPVYLANRKKVKKERGSKVLFESKKCKLIFIMNKKACQTYGANTKWCITSKDKPYWETYTKKAFFIFLINKEYEEKYAFEISIEALLNPTAFWNNIDIFDFQDNKVSPDILEKYDIPKDKFKAIALSLTKPAFNLMLSTELDSLTKNDDGTYSIKGDFYTIPHILVNPSTHKLLIKFADFVGSFYVAHLNLTSLEGCPSSVKGGVIIHNLPNLTTLKGMPQYIDGDLILKDCPKLQSLKEISKTITELCTLVDLPKLKNLIGAPEEVVSLSIAHCKELSSLKGAPKTIHYNFDINDVPKLVSLEGGPLEVKNIFSCTLSKIKNLKGSPRKTEALYLINNPELTSLEGIGEVERFVNVNECSKLLEEEVQKYRDLGYTIYKNF